MMVRDFFFPTANVLPRKREDRPEGLGTHFLWTRKGEWSRNDSLAQLLMPKEWARVERLRKARRDRVLRERASQSDDQAVPAGIAAGRVVAEEAGEPDGPREGFQEAAVAAEVATKQHSPCNGSAEAVEGERDARSQRDPAEDATDVGRRQVQADGNTTEAAAEGTFQRGVVGEHAAEEAAPDA